jgi:hypothetical protein
VGKALAGLWREPRGNQKRHYGRDLQGTAYAAQEDARLSTVPLWVASPGGAKREELGEANCINTGYFYIWGRQLLKQFVRFTEDPRSIIDLGLVTTVITAASVALLICAELP